MTSKKLRDVKISEAFIKSDQLLELFNSLETRLEDVDATDIQTIMDTAEILNYIIVKFGGKSSVEQVFEVEIPDIAGKKNLFLYNNISPFGQNITIEFERI